MVIALLLLLAAGTHTTSQTPGLRPATTACRVLTRFDVQLALGRAVGQAQEQTTAAGSTCDFATPRARVTVTLQRLDAAPDLPAEIVALRREIADSTVGPAPAIPPHAFFLDIAGAGTQLHIIRGRDYLLISVLGFGDAASVSAAVERMAQTALARMPVNCPTNSAESSPHQADRQHWRSPSIRIIHLAACKPPTLAERYSCVRATTPRDDRSRPVRRHGDVLRLVDLSRCLDAEPPSRVQPLHLRSEPL